MRRLKTPNTTAATIACVASWRDRHVSAYRIEADSFESAGRMGKRLEPERGRDYKIINAGFFMVNLGFLALAFF